MDIQAALLERVLIWAMDVDPEDCRTEIRWRQGRDPELSRRQLARKLMTEYSVASLAEGALTALASGPFLAIPAALVDTAFILRMGARLNGCIGLLANPEYFSDDRWRADAMTLIGNDPIAQQGMRRSTLQVTNRVAIQLASRAGFRRLVPVLGGVVGGAWNFLEVRAMAARIYDYHFDASVSDEAPSPAVVKATPPTVLTREDLAGPVTEPTTGAATEAVTVQAEIAKPQKVPAKAKAAAKRAPKTTAAVTPPAPPALPKPAATEFATPASRKRKASVRRSSRPSGSGDDDE